MEGGGLPPKVVGGDNGREKRCAVPDGAAASGEVPVSGHADESWWRALWELDGAGGEQEGGRFAMLSFPSGFHVGPGMPVDTVFGCCLTRSGLSFSARPCPDTASAPRMKSVETAQLY